MALQLAHLSFSVAIAEDFIATSPSSEFESPNIQNQLELTSMAAVNQDSDPSIITKDEQHAMEISPDANPVLRSRTGPVVRSRTDSRVAIFRDREVERKDPDYGQVMLIGEKAEKVCWLVLVV
ncbi:hypothetical protein L1987_29189 [Smallanthus sonchifolius]|uniref:Uncharacterized protein n=1 Tax=Smallanthus sonchifolius TaxID=185202 RepID=A0ACB9I051_9ASTR|nr:hypothetical protein L1987_29189 [Smallanthus sonchifolius]